jgi:hypothetical protein
MEFRNKNRRILEAFCHKQILHVLLYKGELQVTCRILNGRTDRKYRLSWNGEFHWYDFRFLMNAKHRECFSVAASAASPRSYGRRYVRTKQSSLGGMYETGATQRSVCTAIKLCRPCKCPEAAFHITTKVSCLHILHSLNFFSRNVFSSEEVSTSNLLNNN